MRGHFLCAPANPGRDSSAAGTVCIWQQQVTGEHLPSEWLRRCAGYAERRDAPGANAISSITPTHAILEDATDLGANEGRASRQAPWMELTGCQGSRPRSRELGSAAPQGFDCSREELPPCNSPTNPDAPATARLTAPPVHPLSAIRTETDEPLRSMSSRPDRLRFGVRHPSLSPAQSVRALLARLLQTLQANC